MHADQCGIIVNACMLLLSRYGFIMLLYYDIGSAVTAKPLIMLYAFKLAIGYS